MFAALAVGFAAGAHAIVAQALPETRVVADLSAACRAACADGATDGLSEPLVGGSEPVGVYSSTAAAAEAISHEMQRCGRAFIEALDALRAGGATRESITLAHCVSDLPPETADAWKALKESAKQCLRDVAFVHAYPSPSMDVLRIDANRDALLRAAQTATDAAYAAISKAPGGGSAGASVHSLVAMQRRIYRKQSTPLSDDPSSDVID